MRHTTTTLGVLLCMGCGGVGDEDTDPGDQGIQIGDEGSFGCTIDTVDPVDDANEVIEELGLSATQAQAGMIGAFSGDGVLHDGTTLDPLLLTLAEPTAMDWIETAHPDGSSDDSCTPYLRLTLDAHLDGGDTVTTDLGGTLSIAKGQSLLLMAVDIDDVDGSLEPLWVVPADMAWTELRLLGTHSDTTWTGAIGYLGCNDNNECSPPVSADGTDAELSYTASL